MCLTMNSCSPLFDRNKIEPITTLTPLFVDNKAAIKGTLGTCKQGSKSTAVGAKLIKSITKDDMTRSWDGGCDPTIRDTQSALDTFGPDRGPIRGRSKQPYVSELIVEEWNIYQYPTTKLLDFCVLRRG